MATVDITFSCKKSASLTPLVTLRQFPTGESQQLHFADGDEVRTLVKDAVYVVSWEVIGQIDDTLTVSWKGDGRAETLIDEFKIDPHHSDARPWPGGKWFDHGITGLRP